MTPRTIKRHTFHTSLRTARAAQARSRSLGMSRMAGSLFFLPRAVMTNADELFVVVRKGAEWTA